MLSTFNPLSAPMTFYVLLNWLLLLATLSALLFIYLRHRYLFAKPSIVLVGLAHILFQWPLAIYSGYYETWLPRPYDLVLLIHGVILVGLIVGALTFRTITQNAWQTITTSKDPDSPVRCRAIAILFALTAAMAVIYLLYVPPACTGLYVLLTNPRWAPLAREYSLKLIADPVPRYALSLLASAVVPLLTAFITAEILEARRKLTLRNISYGLGLLPAWAAASMGGSNSIIVSLSLVIVFAILWSRALTISVVRLPLLLAAALAPAFALFFLYFLLGSGQLRAGDPQYDYARCVGQMRQTTPMASRPEALEKALVVPDPSKVSPPATPSARPPMPQFQVSVSDIAAAAMEQAQALLYRAFVVPFQVGTWYVHYAQARGPIGIAAVPRIAQALGVEPVRGPAVIGLEYGPQYYGRPVADTLWASAGYWLTYYGYFGPLALLLLPILLWLSDIAVGVYRYLPAPFCLPLAAALSLALMRFLESDYTAVWLTHGFGVMMLIVLALGAVSRGSIRNTA